MFESSGAKMVVKDREPSGECHHGESGSVQQARDFSGSTEDGLINAVHLNGEITKATGYFPRRRDDLGPARGIGASLAFSLLLWSIFALVVWL